MGPEESGKGKVPPLGRRKLGRRFVQITKCPRGRAERFLYDLAYKYTNKINYQLLVRVLKKVNTAPISRDASASALACGLALGLALSPLALVALVTSTKAAKHGSMFRGLPPPLPWPAASLGLGLELSHLALARWPLVMDGACVMGQFGFQRPARARAHFQLTSTLRLRKKPL
jgi:hypothetical protein